MITIVESWHARYEESGYVIMASIHPSSDGMFSLSVSVPVLGSPERRTIPYDPDRTLESAKLSAEAILVNEHCALPEKITWIHDREERSSNKARNLA
jgi:hypothetical protein